jgi:hypothetical protein
MNRRIVFVIISLLISISAFSQSKGKWVTGGALSADYRDDGYYIEAAPKFGYKFKLLEVGIAPFFSYQEVNQDYAYGLQTYCQLTVYENIFIHGEFQAANAYVSSEMNRQWVLGMPLGVGYEREIADNVLVKAALLYDVFYKEGFTPQENPVVRVGMTYLL